MVENTIIELNQSVELNPGMLKIIQSAVNSTTLQSSTVDKLLSYVNDDSCVLFSKAVSEFNNNLKQEPEVSGLIDRISGTFEIFSYGICILKNCSPSDLIRNQEKTKSVCPNFNSRLAAIQTPLPEIPVELPREPLSEINNSQESFSLTNVLNTLALSIIIVGGLTLIIPKLTKKLFPLR